jgi:hypothetical protein
VNLESSICAENELPRHANKQMGVPRTEPQVLSSESHPYLKICIGFLPSVPMAYQAVAPMC